MRTFLAACLLLSLLTACLSPPGAPPSRDGPWSLALRAIDPADTATPARDITAVYLRQEHDRLQIRVDLLDIQSTNDLSLEVRIGDDSSPTAPPRIIHIPSEGDPARFTLDPLLATVIVEVPLAELPSRPRVDVSTPEEAVTGLAPDGPVPTRSAPVLLTFYDTFAARFPAEALRSWDGAHTGPRGERHGLKHLLDAVKAHQVPIVLLDLKDRETLSALDAMGVLAQIQQMEQDGLLLLPDVQEQEALFGFSPSPFAWGTLRSRLIFAPAGDLTAHLYHPILSQTTYLPFAAETASTRSAPDGPSLEVRRALLEIALNTDEKDLLVLGGSLRDSTWGSAEMAGATLAYFASRPYIEVLTADELIDFPAIRGKPEWRDSPLEDPLETLTTHYQTLTRPALEFAANWQGSPLSSCHTDLDMDSQPECVLANETYLAILDPRGARLTHLFIVERVGREASPTGSNPPHIQLIGPSWQVAAGLSNPSLWDLSAGEAADPGAYPGAFADADDPFKPYVPAVGANKVTFTSLDGTRTKTFRIDETGLNVAYQMQEPVLTQIPLLVEPETRFTPGWAGKYRQEEIPGGIAWGLVNGPKVRIQADGPVEMRAFNDSLSLLTNPENPDFDYPPGHYIPFPMAIAEIQLESGMSTIQIGVSP